MASTYRRRNRSDSWHFCAACSKWPVATCDERYERPASGEFCNECTVKQVSEQGPLGVVA